MIKEIKITVAKEDYWKSRAIVEPYAKGCMSVASHDGYYTIIIPCSTFKIKRCKHDIDLAIALGINIKIGS